MEKVSTVFVFNFLFFFRRILKAEYNRTNNKTILKAQFPSLLNQLWQTDAIKGKTNIIKSFMKAGVFPLNPNSINHSRLIQNSASNNNSTSNMHTDNAQTSGPSSPVNNDTSDEDNQINENQPQINKVASFSHHSYPSFTTSRAAIDALDKVLENTLSNDGSNENNQNDDDDEDEDENYVPNRPINKSSIEILSSTRKPPSYKQSSNLNSHQVRSKSVSFDTIDEDSNSDTFINSSDNLFLPSGYVK